MSGKIKGVFDHKSYYKRQRNAESLRVQGLYSEAADLFRQNLADSSQCFSPGHANVLNDRDRLANCLHELGRYQAAITIDEETLRLRYHHGKEAKDTMQTQVNLACSLNRLGQFERAIALYRTVLTIRKKTLGDTHPDTLDTRNEMVRILHKHGDFAEAFRHNLYLLDVLAESRRADDYDLILCKHNLAISWCAFENYECAMQLTVREFASFTKNEAFG